MRKGMAVIFRRGHKIFHLPRRVLDDIPGNATLCHTHISFWSPGIRICSIAEAQADGLRLCIKCWARYQAIWDRLREVDGQVVRQDD